MQEKAEELLLQLGVDPEKESFSMGAKALSMLLADQN